MILDNITGPLESVALCILLTAQTWSDRLLGVNKDVRLPTSLLAIATGNNLKIVGDLCRRVLPIEMDAKCESPELRLFDRQLEPWAIENRGKLVAAALTILACYRRAGSPLPDGFAALGSFDEWSKAICGALVWLKQPDPRKAMEATRDSDPEKALLARFMVSLTNVFGHKDHQTVASIFQTLKTAEASDSPSEKYVNLREVVDEIASKARDEKGAKIMLGRWLEAHKGRVVDNMVLECVRNTDRKVNEWRAWKPADEGAEEPADEVTGSRVLRVVPSPRGISLARPRARARGEN